MNVSSGVTRVATPGTIAYSMTKGALNVLTHTLAAALGSRDITVNSVAPGVIETDMNAALTEEHLAAARAASTFKRLGTPDDIADIIAFVASDDARWVTGQYIDATGGAKLGV
ncbi:SDR family NAD(P)-dependent oxidoreductase [Spongiactinospora gelatinilytica]|uniref:SDR family NAD(P)-dependent oxidoreductase n=1 Tax=Spongiactinospora gelatinilytica TaxID=2666298 RepID=UPI0027B9A034|nr:SDR family oxidoreductase [Spongiactinospora gelatinilytica]